MFPKTFGFRNADGSITENELFADLIKEMEKYLTENQDLKDLLNGIEVEAAEGVVPKRPAMISSQADDVNDLKATAKVHPEDDDSISVRTADGTMIDELV